ncbi:DinB family protein [Paraflavisolibacter sp. H34]|uniref:DinB family protein n=1 Tax=Huijunlia imazamoxiresistens TaxID=3127457 RepID=UPI003018CF71
MPTYTPTALLQDLQLQTENILDKAVGHWQMIPPESLLRAPGENRWSAAQCLEHLNSYGRYYLPAIEKAISAAEQKGPAPSPTFTSGWLGHYFYQLMLPKEKGMKKMKAPKDHIPASNLDSDAVLREFIDQQEQLLLLLERAKGIDPGRAKVAISIAPFLKLKLGDVFLFLVAHHQRHVLQAEKAMGISDVGFRISAPSKQ